jgi:hypothetical protein
MSHDPILMCHRDRIRKFYRLQAIVKRLKSSGKVQFKLIQSEN